MNYSAGLKINGLKIISPDVSGRGGIWMPRKLFEQHLHDLQDHVLTMGSMVETSIYRSMESLKNRNLELAQKVIDDDSLIDQKRYEIEEECIDLIVTQQPMAGDLRIII